MDSAAVIVVLGPLGHGKTFLTSKLCANSLSTGGTRYMQGTHLFHNDKAILVVDVPGLYYYRIDLMSQLAKIKLTLEGVKVSAVFVVAKYARADDSINALEPIVDAIGPSLTRIILTHADVASQKAGFCPEEMRDEIEDQLAVPPSHVGIFGKESSSQQLRDFVCSTLIDEPTCLYMSGNEAALARMLLNGIRTKRQQSVEVALEQLVAARNSCVELLESSRRATSEEAPCAADFVGRTIQKEALCLAERAKREFANGVGDNDQCSDDEKIYLLGRAHVTVDLAMLELRSAFVRGFADSEAKQKRACNYCGLAHCREVADRGVDSSGTMRCGGSQPQRSLDGQRIPPVLTVYFSDEPAAFRCKLRQMEGSCLPMDAASLLSQSAKRDGSMKSRPHASGNVVHVGNGHKFDHISTYQGDGGGCGARISWDLMLPADAELCRQARQDYLSLKAAMTECAGTGADKRLRPGTDSGKQWNHCRLFCGISLCFLAVLASIGREHLLSSNPVCQLVRSSGSRESQLHGFESCRFSDHLEN